jgi:hypothetical protein
MDLDMKCLRSVTGAGFKQSHVNGGEFPRLPQITLHALTTPSERSELLTHRLKENI